MVIISLVLVIVSLYCVCSSVTCSRFLFSASKIPSTHRTARLLSRYGSSIWEANNNFTYDVNQKIYNTTTNMDTGKK